MGTRHCLARSWQGHIVCQANIKRQLVLIIRSLSCPDKSESLGFPIFGMKFDVVTQWVIAYGQLVIYPFAGLAVALGRMVLT